MKTWKEEHKPQKITIILVWIMLCKLFKKNENLKKVTIKKKDSTKELFLKKINLIVLHSRLHMFLHCDIWKQIQNYSRFKWIHPKFTFGIYMRMTIQTILTNLSYIINSLFISSLDLFDQDGNFSNPSMRYIVQISSYCQNWTFDQKFKILNECWYKTWIINVFQ
jgi:hypothetical protein